LRYFLGHSRLSASLISLAQPAIKRAIAFAPYADLIWLETKEPDLEQARYFARKIRAKYPGK
jgi:isocitrate lyase